MLHAFSRTSRSTKTDKTIITPHICHQLNLFSGSFQVDETSFFGYLCKTLEHEFTNPLLVYVAGNLLKMQFCNIKNYTIDYSASKPSNEP